MKSTKSKTKKIRSTIRSIKTKSKESKRLLIVPKNTIYDDYIEKLKRGLASLSSTTQYPPLIGHAPLSHMHAADFFHHAEQRYMQNYQKTPVKYLIQGGGGSSIQYSAKENQSIALGTFALHTTTLGHTIMNMYKVQQKHAHVTLETFRFGTPVYHFDEIASIVREIKLCGQKRSKQKLICISLLSPCNSNACQSLAIASQPLAIFSKLFQKGLSATKETRIVDMELSSNAKTFHGIQFFSVLFPMSSQDYKGVGHELMPIQLKTFLYEKEKILESHTEKSYHLKRLYDCIDNSAFNDGQRGFESIVNIAMYYYEHLKDDYILAYHCKSGKDRTSIFDSIVQATFFYRAKKTNKSNVIDYEFIRQKSKWFLLFGLIIAYNSTSVVGLKLKNITIAKYIFFDEPQKLDAFIGHSNLCSS